jgi:hypothetical protein
MMFRCAHRAEKKHTPYSSSTKRPRAADAGFAVVVAKALDLFEEKLHLSSWPVLLLRLLSALCVSLGAWPLVYEPFHYTHLGFLVSGQLL